MWEQVCSRVYQWCRNQLRIEGSVSGNIEDLRLAKQ